jgi:hypothetical protein
MNWFDEYRGSVICNIHRGVGARWKYIYAEIRDNTGKLLVSADLEYCTNRMIEVATLLNPEK